MSTRLVNGEYISAVVVIDPATGEAASGGLATTVADGADIALGAKADTRATWYDASASLLAHFKLSIAAAVGAGSHAYGYDSSGNLITDAWTLFGTTRTKTYTWVSGNMTAETDWV